jgi:hypothetical protein
MGRDPILVSRTAFSAAGCNDEASRPSALAAFRISLGLNGLTASASASCADVRPMRSVLTIDENVRIVAVSQG